jgi:hypothetical protein
VAKADKTPLIDLRFPVGGLNRQAGFDQQPPYTTPYCLNVRPFDSVALSTANMHGYRQRGGARPGIVKAYAQRVETGPIQMLDFAAVLNSAGVVSNILLAASAGCLYQNANGSLLKVASYPHFNATAAQLQGTQVGQKFYVADYRPVNLNGTDGTIANTNQLSATSVPSWTALSPAIDTAKDVVYISGSVDTEANIFPITDASNSGYIVFDGVMTTQSGGVTWQIGRVAKVYDPSTPTIAPVGIMGIPTSGGIPASNYRVGTISSVAPAAYVTLDSGPGSWANVPHPVNYTTNLMTLSIPNDDGIGSTDYRVQSIDVSLNRLILVDQTVAAFSGKSYVLSWTSLYYGIPPLNCPLCCPYRGKLVLAGWPEDVFYMSRVDDPNNWDYGFDPTDPDRAVGGTAYRIPEKITALIPHTDSYLIFGCENSLWMLTADLAYGGTINALSRDVGVIGPTAWCNLPDGSVVFLSRDGLYQIPPGGQSYPQPISRPKLPAELLNIDTTANVVSMCYDVADRGIHLSITPTAGTAGIHYFIDWTTGSFWPVTMPNGIQPTAMVRYSPSSANAPMVILGSFDGYTRNYASALAHLANGSISTTPATTDDGTAISSLITYGPFRVGGPGYYGEILQLAADLDSNGQGASWGIYGGDTAQAAVAAAVAGGTAKWNGTLSAGANHRQYPRAVDAAQVIVISGAYGWAIEGMRIETRRRGPIR